MKSGSGKVSSCFHCLDGMEKLMWKSVFTFLLFGCVEICEVYDKLKFSFFWIMIRNTLRNSVLFVFL